MRYKFCGARIAIKPRRMKMKYILKTTGLYGRRGAIFGLLTISCLVTSIAFAQNRNQTQPRQNQQSEGPRDGAGGLAVRLDIVAVRNYLYEICDQLETLKKENISCETLRTKMDEVGTGELLVLKDVVIVDGKDRDGRNRYIKKGNKLVPEITFSRKNWLECTDDNIRKIGLELHEYLGLLGIEGTDDYHVSSVAVNELREKGGYVNRIIDAQAFPLFKEWAIKFIEVGPVQQVPIKNAPFRAISGKTPKGTPCVLFVTHTDDVEGGLFYLSLGFGPNPTGENKANRYIGGYVGPKSDLKMSSNDLNFRSVLDGATKGEVSDEELESGVYADRISDRRLHVELTNSRQVHKVTATSTIAGKVICNFSN